MTEEPAAPGIQHYDIYSSIKNHRDNGNFGGGQHRFCAGSAKLFTRCGADTAG
jgi:hypothetical protein